MKMSNYCMVCDTEDPYKCNCDKCELCLEKIDYCKCDPEEKRRHYEL